MSGYPNSGSTSGNGRQFEGSESQQNQHGIGTPQQQQQGPPTTDPSPAQHGPRDAYAQYNMSQPPYGYPQAAPGSSPANHVMSPFVFPGYGTMSDPYRPMSGQPGSSSAPTNGRPNFTGQQPMMPYSGFGAGRPMEYHMPYMSYNPHAFQNGGEYGTDGGMAYPGHDPYELLRKGPRPDDSLNDDNSKPSYKKPMLQKVTSTIGKSKHTARLVERDGTTIIEDGDQQWFTGSVSLGLDDDKYWLSELQVYLRSNFAEAFGATEEDIAAPMHGRNKPIALGQVGIRCMHCKNDNPAERGQQATSYPSMINGIYNSVQQMLRLHLDCCLSMPSEVRQRIEQLKSSCSSRGGRKQYWIDSAKRLGLVDTPHGIHFGRDPLGPLPPLTGPSVNSKEGRTKKKQSKPSPVLPQAQIPAEMPIAELPPPPPPPVDDRPLVFPEDKPLITDYLYLTLEQMAPCILMEADRVGCYKTRDVGFPGLACRHCVGQAGCGRYFPASEASLSQTTTSQTIMNHVRQCRRCPIEIRESLEVMKRSKLGPDGKRADKPKHGGRKVFFHRLWCRIQSLPIEEDNDFKFAETKKRKTRKSTAPRKRRKVDLSDEGSEESGSDDSLENGVQAPKVSPWVHGCVRMTKTDDSSWLSDMEVFARSDLIEVFSHRDEDDLHGYVGRKEPAEGQVGIRCVFCKFLDQSERPNGCVAFPDSLATLHVKVTDMIRLHFPSCPVLPDDARATFRKYKGFDARVASDDSQQYWIDSARDIGLSNLPPKGNRDRGSWGVSFRRDPLEPSPADEFDLDQAKDADAPQQGSHFIREEDAESCTHKIMLLMRQVRPCRFKKSDRRAGSSTRGRDRDIGFPGLCCMHCAGLSSHGRYFPTSAKNLTDNVASNISTHVSSCVHCPESIRASLAYLGHRSILQKAELKGSWKKEFFQKIWDRLHVETDWESFDNDKTSDDDDDDDEEEDDGEDEEDDGEEEGDDEDGEEGEAGGQMDALLKAAAIWLTNQDAANDKSGKGKKKAKRSESAEVSETTAIRGKNSHDGSTESEVSDEERVTRSARKRRARV